MTEFTVLIVAGGTGSRAGNGLPKQYRKLNGRPVLRQTLEAFLGIPGLKTIQVVIHPAHEVLYREAVEGLDLPEPVIGGETRQESVGKGIDALTGLSDQSPVLIHDAARPFIDRETILNCVARLQTAQAVTVAVPVHDTLRRENAGHLEDAVDRQKLWAVQTPQGFHYGLIKRAHSTLKGQYTDDSQMASELGVPIQIIEGKRENIKITTEDDFKSMTRKIIKTGLGCDVHAFGEESTSLRIGGVDVPYYRKLLGHSDADVVLHAITDAIYGTISSGDIGSHFPPSNNEFKNMDSAIFLKQAVEELTREGGEIIHIDTVIICEEPKIGPHRESIRESVAGICGVPVKSVSIKATTSEGLGFTGRREGIACQSLVTIEIDR